MTHSAMTLAAANAGYANKASDENFAGALGRHFESRGQYFKAAIEGIGETVYHLAVGVFKTLVAALTLFTDADRRSAAWDSFKEGSQCIRTSIVGVIGGVICPWAGVETDKWMEGWWAKA